MYRTLYIAMIGLCLFGMLYERRYSKYTGWIHAAILILCVVFMAHGNAEKYDLVNYATTYANIQNGQSISSYTDIGYAWLCKTFGLMGFNFYQFRVVLFAVGLLLIFHTIRRYTRAACFFFLFYMCHSMLMDAGQIRNFLGTAIIVFALPYLLEDGKKNLVIYIVCVVLAALIHFSMCVYLAFAFLRAGRGILKYLRIVVPVCIVIGYYIFRTGALNQIIAYAVAFINDSASDKLSSYLSATTRLGFLGPTIVYVGFAAAIRYFNRMEEYHGSSVVRKADMNRELKLVIKDEVICIDDFMRKTEYINYIGLLFLLFSILNLTFYRLVRNICVFDWIYFAVMYQAVETKKKRRTIFGIGIVLLVGWLIWDFYFYLGSNVIGEVYFYE